MFTKSEMFLLRQASTLLDKKEQETKSLETLPAYMVRNADDQLSALVHYADDHPEWVSRFWNEDLEKAIAEGRLSESTAYTPIPIKGRSGEFTLNLLITNTDEELIFEFYIDEDCIVEDLEELKKLGFSIGPYSEWEEEKEGPGSL